MSRFPWSNHQLYPSIPLAMPYILPPIFNRLLIYRIAEHPDGATREQIASEVSIAGERRTVQRLLSRLVDAGWIIRVGKGRHTRYQLAPGRSIPASWPEPLRARASAIATPPPRSPASISQPAPGCPPAISTPPPAVSPGALPARQPASTPPPSTGNAGSPGASTAQSPARRTADQSATKPAPAAVAPPVATPASAAPKPVRPPVPPMTPKEHALWDETLKELLPPMVKTAMKRHDAWMYADRVAGRMRPADAERFHAIVEAELDTLTPDKCLAYGITPDSYQAWRRKWDRS